MKLIAQIKLQTTKEQGRQLKTTLERANQACNYISEWAWDNRVFSNFKIQKAIYQEIRRKFNLSSQMTIRAISKVTDAYKLDKKTKRTFSKYGSIAYDLRILTYKLDTQIVSILSLDGRLKIPFVTGEKQLEMLKSQQGQSDLVYRKGIFYLYATCNIDEPDKFLPDGVLGIDLGIVNIATDSTGKQHSGSEVLSLRKRRRRQRKRMQKKGTKGARRRLKKLSGKERRFAKHINHCLSKQIVKKAKGTMQAIALENLKGIRKRARLRKPQRINLHSWSFHQLGQFVLYKAALAGVPVVFVDPKYTSQQCSKPECGCIDKGNRKSQDKFLCKSCGFALNADYNAARNIAFRGWGLVSGPFYSDASVIAFGGLASVAPG